MNPRSLFSATGDRVRLKSQVGETFGRVVIAPLRPRSVQLHWPGGNVLLLRNIDPSSLEPSDKAFPEITKAPDA